MGRRGPEKIARSHPSGEPTIASPGIETNSSKEESGEAPSFPIPSAGGETADRDRCSDQETAGSEKGRFEAEGDRLAGVRGTMAGCLG